MQNFEFKICVLRVSTWASVSLLISMTAGSAGLAQAAEVQQAESSAVESSAVESSASEPSSVEFSEFEQWLPPEEDVPEEVLRTELILEGRSPINGSLLSPEDYAALEVQLQQSQTGPLPVDSELQSLVFQLKLLNLVKSVFPFSRLLF